MRNNYQNNDITISVLETFYQFWELQVTQKENKLNHNWLPHHKRNNFSRNSFWWDLSEIWTCLSLSSMIFHCFRVYWGIFSQDRFQLIRLITPTSKAGFQQLLKKGLNWSTDHNSPSKSSKFTKHLKYVTVSCCWVSLQLVNLQS